MARANRPRTTSCAPRPRRIGLDISIDAIGNLTMTLPGRDRSAQRIIIGSHLDSVPQGGNYDGAAGVVAGLSVLSALKKAGFEPRYDLAVMGIRAEESAWFDVPYIGSAGAFGLLDPACLSIARSDNGRTLESTLIERGFDPEAIRETAAPARSVADPRLPGAAHRAGSDAGRQGTARRGGDRHPRVQALS